MYTHFVYIMASASGTLYVGVTRDLPRRVYEHKHALAGGFTARYRVNRLVWFEAITEGPTAAILREKQIKGWKRERKVELVEATNPGWRDLSLEMRLVEAPSNASSS